MKPLRSSNVKPSLLSPAWRGQRHVAIRATSGDSDSQQKANKANPAKSNPALVKALETALQSVSKIVIDAERKRKTAAASGTLTADSIKAKQVAFKADSSGDRLVKAPHLPGRTLSAYLALTLDQYSLLDPRWISRDTADPSLFLLKVPLYELTGLELEPRLSIRVDLDPAASQVKFHATQFSVGQPKFDRNFKLDLKARLQKRKVPERSPFNFWRRGSKAQEQEPQPQQVQAAAVSTAVPAQPATANSDSDGASVEQHKGSSEGLKASAVMEEARTNNGASSSGASAAGQSTSSPAAMLSASRGDGSHAAEQQLDGVAREVSESAASGSSSSMGVSTGANLQRPYGSSTSSPASSSMAGDASSSSTGTDSCSNSSDSDAGDESRSLTVSSSVPLETSPALLWCSVDVQVEAMVPHPLSAVPGPLLNLTFSLITKFVIQQLLPAFLQLLSIDYGRWASGAARSPAQPAGSLLKNAVTVSTDTSTSDEEEPSAPERISADSDKDSPVTKLERQGAGAMKP